MMHKSIQRIAVLLTVHNRKNTTIDCLKKLYECNIPENFSLESYLVDDGCTDGTSEAVCQYFPQVNVINGNGNLYWNRGMWTAWNEASKKDYDYYLWLNDDTSLYTCAISSLLNTSVHYNDNAIIVGATENESHTAITYGGRIDGKIPIPEGNDIEVEYFNGNIVLIPRCVFRILGNLDFFFSHSKGDFDYGMRANEESIKMIQVGHVLGICEKHKSIDKWCDPSISFIQRWKFLHKPIGMPPNEIFHLNRRHYGLLSAFFHYITVYVRCIIPRLWIQK